MTSHSSGHVSIITARRADLRAVTGMTMASGSLAGAVNLPLLELVAFEGGRLALVQLWRSLAASTTVRGIAGSLAARGADGVEHQMQPLHHVGIRPNDSGLGKDLLLELRRAHAAPARLLAAYDRLIDDVRSSRPLPLAHLCIAGRDSVTLAHVWRSMEHRATWRASEVGRKVCSHIEPVFSPPLLLPVQQLTWCADLRSVVGPRLPFGQRYTVFCNRTMYRVDVHPRFDGAGELVGHVANVYDRRGRIVGGSDIEEAADVSSNITWAEQLVRRVLAAS